MTSVAPADGDSADLENPFVECRVCGETYLDEGFDCPYCSEPEEDMPL